MTGASKNLTYGTYPLLFYAATSEILRDARRFLCHGQPAPIHRGPARARAWPGRPWHGFGCGSAALCPLWRIFSCLALEQVVLHCPSSRAPTRPCRNERTSRGRMPPFPLWEAPMRPRLFPLILLIPLILTLPVRAHQKLVAPPLRSAHAYVAASLPRHVPDGTWPRHGGIPIGSG